MSDCANGGRSPRRWFDADRHEERPIRMELRYAGGMRPTRFTTARYVNGEERTVEGVVVDGTRFVPAPERDWDDVEAVD